LRVVLIREIPEDENLRQEWNALVRSLENAQVFYTYEWALAVQRAYRGIMGPLLFLAYEGKSLVGVAALATNQAKRVSFLCATTGDYCDFLSTPENKPAFVAAVFAELKNQRFKAVTLANLPEDSTSVAALREASRGNGFHFFARTAYECAQISLDSLERRGSDDRLVLPKEKKLRRSLNAMGRDSAIRLDHSRTEPSVVGVLPDFIQAHVARFLLTGRISNLAHQERRVFLEELAKLLSQSGWITLTRMMTGTTPLAWNYGFEFENTWFWYQPTFDSAVEKYSPGFCLLAMIVQEAAADPALKIVDLGLGAEEYKTAFGNQTRKTLYVTLRSSITQHLREEFRYHTASIVKRSPQLESVIRRSIAFSRRITERLRLDGLERSSGRFARLLIGLLWRQREVFFFEAQSQCVADGADATVRPIDLNSLATALCQYIDDSETCNYLLRCAARLREGSAEGFYLADHEGNFLHFAWVAPFAGFFLAELNAKVDAPAPDSVLLFDCWTPPARRGRGHYAAAIRHIAKMMQDQGRRPWIFSAATNDASLKGIEKAGFQFRYSLLQQHVLGFQKIKRSPLACSETPVSEVSVRA
jgi:CelD/BcsL family acetyltransferase involved in cellulose biosynthesis